MGHAWRVSHKAVSVSTCLIPPGVLGFDTLTGMGVLMGYARVSTTDQDASLQIDALTEAGCYRIFTDQISGATGQRPQLDSLMDQIRPEDTLVVWRLDRLGRSLRHLIDSLTELEEMGVGFRSLSESIDTTSPGGRLVFHVFGALAEFERELLSERTKAGLAAARARGRLGGRPALLTADQVAEANRMYERQDMTVSRIGEVLGVSRATIYRALNRPPGGSTSRRRTTRSAN